MSPTAAVNAAAVIAPTPGTLISRRISAELRASEATSFSIAATSDSQNSIWRVALETDSRSAAGSSSSASHRRPALPNRSLNSSNSGAVRRSHPGGGFGECDAGAEPPGGGTEPGGARAHRGSRPGAGSSGGSQRADCPAGVRGGQREIRSFVRSRPSQPRRSRSACACWGSPSACGLSMSCRVKERCRSERSRRRSARACTMSPSTSELGEIVSWEVVADQTEEPAAGTWRALARQAADREGLLL
jgi:hypothetical protein